MPTKITKYKTVDGLEFEKFNEAHAHESNLKVVSDVHAAIVEAIDLATDDKKRPMFQVDEQTTKLFANILIETNLMARLKVLLK